MRILVFGDSISQGFHDIEGGGWVDRLKQFVMHKDVTEEVYDRSVVNLGISGDTTEDVLKRVREESEVRVVKYPTESYDVLLLSIGVNDSQFEISTGANKIPIEKTVKNLQKIVSSTEDLFGKVVIVGIAPVWDPRIQPMAWKITHGYSNEQINEYNKQLRKFAADQDAQFIDLSDVYDDVDACLPDGIHPNARGHKLIYERVKSELEKAGIL